MLWLTVGVAMHGDPVFLPCFLVQVGEHYLACIFTQPERQLRFQLKLHCFLVQVGEHYLAEGWGQQLMTLQQFVQRHIVPPGAAAAPTAPATATAAAAPGAAAAPASDAAAIAAATATAATSKQEGQQSSSHPRQGGPASAGGEGAGGDGHTDAEAQLQGGSQQDQRQAAPGREQQDSQAGNEQQQAAQHTGMAAGRGYLAQHPLFDQIPALAADIRVSLV